MVLFSKSAQFPRCINLMDNIVHPTTRIDIFFVLRYALSFDEVVTKKCEAWFCLEVIFFGFEYYPPFAYETQKEMEKLSLLYFTFLHLFYRLLF